VVYTGDITMPIPGEVRVGGHAMCIVGCIDLPDRHEIGGGRFILRNSWDAKWGISSPYGTGYGSIPYAYIARFGTEAYSVG
jgi:C1A family cysteine protease